MDTIFDEVDKRANLALTNQMEMLIFYLNDQQLYGINVFKIIEIIECPKNITRMPLSNPSIKGTVDFRGKAVVVIDLGDVLGMPPVDYKNTISYVIICEYNNAVNGFLISRPDSLITRSWDEIKSPSGLLSQSSAYLTAIAYADNGETIQLLDIEKVLAEIVGIDEDISEETKEQGKDINAEGQHVLVVDDSKTARMMVKTVLTQLGIACTTMDSAVAAMEHLTELQASGKRVMDIYNMVICDIEMPGMDGFTFVRTVRAIPAMADLYIMLHSSLSNPANQSKAELVGANDFLAKFSPDVLAQRIMEKIKLS